MMRSAAGPVVEVRFPIVGRAWITTTSELAARVLKDNDTFTMRQNGIVAGVRWWMPRSISALAVSMLSMDEPDHTRLRSIVDEAFRRRAVLEMEPRIFALADEIASAAELASGKTSRQPVVLVRGAPGVGGSGSITNDVVMPEAMDLFR